MRTDKLKVLIPASRFLKVRQIVLFGGGATDLQTQYAESRLELQEFFFEFFLDSDQKMSIFNCMVKYYTAPLDTTFMALADATRRAILTHLAKQDRTVSELAEPFAMSLPAVSKHVKILEKAGLLSKRKEGRTYRCSLNAGPMKDAVDWMTAYEQFWQKQLHALEKFIQGSNEKEEA